MCIQKVSVSMVYIFSYFQSAGYVFITCTVDVYTPIVAQHVMR
jgi:hypothetical protein